MLGRAISEIQPTPWINIASVDIGILVFLVRRYRLFPFFPRRVRCERTATFYNTLTMRFINFTPSITRSRSVKIIIGFI